MKVRVRKVDFGTPVAMPWRCDLVTVMPASTLVPARGGVDIERVHVGMYETQDEAVRRGLVALKFATVRTAYSGDANYPVGVVRVDANTGVPYVANERPTVGKPWWWS